MARVCSLSPQVLCAFCLHRFYSAEDLRRHMRTHTKEQPFACQSCKRRFTLKHSMVRHIAKKHGGAGVGDAEQPQQQQHHHHQYSYQYQYQRSRSSSPRRPPTGAAYDDCPSRDENRAADTGLIGTLLGIRDNTVIDQVLQTKSPEDAAKMLGIENNE
jgi:hypothetical protein